MKRSRFAEEQIIGILREQEAGAKTAELCRRHGISSATFYAWTPAAYAAQLAAMGDRLHETEAVRRSPIAPSAQAGNCHPPALVSHG
jgi:putative transposase